MHIFNCSSHNYSTIVTQLWFRGQILETSTFQQHEEKCRPPSTERAVVTPEPWIHKHCSLKEGCAAPPLRIFRSTINTHAKKGQIPGFPPTREQKQQSRWGWAVTLRNGFDWSKQRLEASYRRPSSVAANPSSPGEYPRTAWVTVWPRTPLQLWQEMPASPHSIGSSLKIPY